MAKSGLIFFLILLSNACVLPSLAKSDSYFVKKHTLSHNTLKQYQLKGMEIRGVLQMDNIENASPPFNELSGLEWDEDEQLLHIISDNGGLFQLKPVFKNEELIDANLLSRQTLKDRNQIPLSGKNADSEGLALINQNNGIKGDTKLLISFERKPRVIRYKANGEYEKKESIAPVLKKKSSYQKKNKQLEAITYHPAFGLLTGPERPLVDSDGSIGIFSNKERVSQLTLAHATHGSLVGLTTLPDGNILALERIFINVFTGLQFVIHHLKLNKGTFKQTKILSSYSQDGFFNDNFEGISHHKDNYFFMISDDNANALQRTLLIYFRLPGLAVGKALD